MTVDHGLDIFVFDMGNVKVDKWNAVLRISGCFA